MSAPRGGKVAADGAELPADVLVVSLGSTAGLRAADDALVASMRRAGARVATVRARRVPSVRTMALTDLAWAWSARRAAQRGIARHRPRAVLYSSVGAALLWPRPGAIRLDSPAALNRPGRHGLWQRPRERRLLRRCPLLVPWDVAALHAVPVPRPAAVVLPPPVRASGARVPWHRREVSAVAYVADPHKKGLDRVLAAWAVARRDGEVLHLCGAPSRRLRAALGAPLGEGVQVAGSLGPGEFRALLRRTRVLVHLPRREDHGQVPLEALADGCRLVTGPAAGPHVALGLARAVAPELVVGDADDATAVAAAVRRALDEPRPDGHPEPGPAVPVRRWWRRGGAAAPRDAAGSPGGATTGTADGTPASTGPPTDADRAAQVLAPFGDEQIDRVVASDLLPLLLGDG